MHGVCQKQKKKQIVDQEVAISALNDMDEDTARPPEEVSVIDFGGVTIPTGCKSEALKTAGLYCSPIKIKDPQILCSVDGVGDKINEDKCPKFGQIDFSTLCDASAVIIEKNQDPNNINGQNKVKKPVKHRRQCCYGAKGSKI